jgi:hypothetical protein
VSEATCGRAAGGTVYVCSLPVGHAPPHAVTVDGNTWEWFDNLGINELRARVTELGDVVLTLQAFAAQLHARVAALETAEVNAGTTGEVEPGKGD